MAGDSAVHASVYKSLTQRADTTSSPHAFAQIQDNLWDVAPPVLFFIGLVSFVKYERKQILLHHRS